jgi:hypothetical protein
MMFLFDASGNGKLTIQWPCSSNIVTHLRSGELPFFFPCILMIVSHPTDGGIVYSLALNKQCTEAGNGRGHPAPH